MAARRSVLSNRVVEGDAARATARASPRALRLLARETREQISLRQIIGFVFIFLFASVKGAAWAGEQTINREVAGLQLGMSFKEASEVFQMAEKEDGLITLMRKYGFGDPEKRTKINQKLGKQVFEIKGNLAEGLSNVEVFFGNGVLYQIALHYGKDYVQKVDWDLFTSPAIKKYGQPIILNDIQNIASFSYRWADGLTKLEIAKGGDLSDDKNKFTPTIYNVFYTDIKTYNAIQEDEKNESERSTVIPKF